MVDVSPQVSVPGIVLGGDVIDVSPQVSVFRKINSVFRPNSVEVSRDKRDMMISLVFVFV